MSEKSGDINQQALMKKALLELRELRSKVKSLENARHEPIAIVGMGCRFPGGADDPQAFLLATDSGQFVFGDVEIASGLRIKLAGKLIIGDEQSPAVLIQGEFSLTIAPVEHTSMHFEQPTISERLCAQMFCL